MIIKKNTETSLKILVPVPVKIKILVPLPGPLCRSLLWWSIDAYKNWTMNFDFLENKMLIFKFRKYNFSKINEWIIKVWKCFSLYWKTKHLSVYIQLFSNNTPVNKSPAEQNKIDTHAKTPIIVEITRIAEIFVDKRLASSNSFRAINRRISRVL